MIEHLKGLINRISQYSLKLDKIASFAGIQWVFIDENSNKQSYIFKRDGRLIMTLSGKAQIGSWEYLPEAESILINRIQDKILLNHVFFDEALMILNYDGALEEDFFILANERKIPDLNIINYLRSKNNAIKIKEAQRSTKKKVNLKLINGDLLTIFTNYNNYNDDISGFNVGDIGIIRDQLPNDGLYISNDGKYNITFSEGSITDFYVNHGYKLSDGTVIIVRCNHFYTPSKGDLANDEKGQPIKSGKYKIGFMDYVTVDNGRIVKFSYF